MLESRINLAEGKILSPRLQTLLLKRRSAAAGRLSARLEQLQNKVANPADHPAQKS